MIESELFGYEKRVFTDAKGRKEGLFEQAEGGTIFLDEIGELELGLQAKLLSVLEEGNFRLVGGLKDLPLDVRIIGASNCDLRVEGEAGRFRLDLYYRLSVIQIDLPPLRERGDDVLALATHYLQHFNEKLRKQISGLSPEVADLFRRYSWPGNVRELRNVIERVMILEDSDLISTAWLPRGFASSSSGLEPNPPSIPAIVESSVAASAPAITAVLTSSPKAIQPMGIAKLFPLPTEGISLELVEMSLVEQAIERSNGNQKRAAELLGISRDQLRYRLKKLEGAHGEISE